MQKDAAVAKYKALLQHLSAVNEKNTPNHIQNSQFLQQNSNPGPAE
jgi:hypothetical protein